MSILKGNRPFLRLWSSLTGSMASEDLSLLGNAMRTSNLETAKAVGYMGARAAGRAAIPGAAGVAAGAVAGGMLSDDTGSGAAKGALLGAGLGIGGGVLRNNWGTATKMAKNLLR